MMQGRVLIIAGSDSGGGAGIQGDIKTVTCLGGYAATAITALTAQSTQGVFGIHSVPPEFVAQQMRLVLEDIGADAIKTGMLHSAEIIDAVARALVGYAAIPLVVDPVMIAKGGSPLLAPEAIDALIDSLLPRAALVTPNIPEAELLAGMPIRNVTDMRKAARRIAGFGAKAVLIKGGHLEPYTEVIYNVLASDTQEEEFHMPRQASTHTHGTGCTLASAIATGLAQGKTMKDSIERAQTYVSAAIAAAPKLGHGHGPLGHNFMISKDN